MPLANAPIGRREDMETVADSEVKICEDDKPEKLREKACCGWSM